jgi:hypothetical protein
MGSALETMQKNIDALQETLGILQHVKDEFAWTSTARVRETMEQNKAASKRDTPLD